MTAPSLRPSYVAFALIVLIAYAALGTTPAWACPYCEERPQVWAGIFNENFATTLLEISVSVPLLIAVGLAFHLVDHRGQRRARQAGEKPPPRRGPLLSAGVLLGIGLGGYLDGIVLHMMLQWHNLIAERLPPTAFVPLKVNMFWDGVFNLGMFVIIAVGVGVFWSAGRLPHTVWSGMALLGALVVGWGIFQVTDGIVFHWVFQLHHIKPGPDWLAWDVGFVVMGIALIGIGWLLIRAGRRGPPRHVSKTTDNTNGAAAP